MAEAMKIHASEIEGLDERLTEIVRQEFDQRPPMEDMEELKRSPAGTLIRQPQFEKIDERFENMVTKEEFAAESKRVQQQFRTFMVQIEEQDKRISLFQKVTYSFLSVMSATMVAILILVIKILLKP